MIRLTIFSLLVFFLIVQSWRGKWFLGACSLVFMMSVLEHPDMPRAIAGIQGLNLWNILMINVVLAWFLHRHREGLYWDIPGGLTFCLFLFSLMILISTVRLMLEPSPYFAHESYLRMTSEFLINTLKWLIPPILIYDGCRTRRRVHFCILSILSVYFVLALLTIRHMPLEMAMASGDLLQKRAGRVLVQAIGYHRVDLAMMLAGGACGIFALIKIAPSLKWKVVCASASMVTLTGLAMTGGRIGLVTFALIGFALSIIKWRRLLWALPIVLFAILTLMPGVKERMFQGFRTGTEAIEVNHEDSEITSGRTTIWPFIIEKIQEKPLVGYGRQAMRRTGLAHWLYEELGEVFGHPHNAYLELLFDNGIIGIFLFMPIYGLVFMRATQLLVDKTDPYITVVGAIAFSLLGSLFIAGLGAQTFYPREGVVSMWASMGLAMRIYQQKYLSDHFGESLFWDDVEDGTDVDDETLFEEEDSKYESEGVTSSIS